MADKTKQKEPKLVLEREYIVPLRRGWLKVPQYKRATKAIKTLKEFLVRHMKVYDRDLRKIKIEGALNNEIRFRGMRKPPAKIKVLAKKFDDDTVQVTLVDIPEHVKYARLREDKMKKEIKKMEKKEEKTSEKTLESKDAEVKEKAEEIALKKSLVEKSSFFFLILLVQALFLLKLQ